MKEFPKVAAASKFYIIHKTKPPAAFGISFAHNNGWLVKFGIYIDKHYAKWLKFSIIIGDHILRETQQVKIRKAALFVQG